MSDEMRQEIEDWVHEEDPVNSPFHYAGHHMEAIDAIKGMLGPVGFRDYCKGNALKYIWRAGRKGYAEEDAKTDLKKARWYIEKMLSL